MQIKDCDPQFSLEFSRVVFTLFSFSLYQWLTDSVFPRRLPEKSTQA